VKVGDFVTFSGCYQVEVRGQKRFEMNSRKRRGMIVQKLAPVEGEVRVRVFSENEFCVLSILEKDVEIQVINESR